jgi:DNA-binding NarL/FixJ family response regulator
MEYRVARASFVGRAGELEMLEDALAAAAASHGSTVLIRGEAGIGKTRLVTELAERARASGTRVLTGRCIDLVGPGVSWLPVVEALRPLRGSPVFAEAPADLRQLSRLVPDLAASQAPPSAEPVSGDSQLRLFEELRSLFERLTNAAPLLLILEDLHWADASTLDLVVFLARSIAGLRALIVCTYRSDELRSDSPLQRLAGELLRARAATAMDLGPLGREHVAEILAATSAPPPSGDLVTRIHERSEGNPYFTEELIAAEARGDVTLPGALRDALLNRVARLDADTRSVLRIASAAGRDISYALIAAVTSLPEKRLLETLEQAVDHGVLLPDQPARAFRFRHALLAEAVYSTLLPGEREAVHGRLAHALAGNPTLVAGRTAMGEAAQHWAAAGRPVEALTTSVQAASDAMSVSGLAEALQHLERVLELWPEVPSARELAGCDLPDVLGRAAELADLTGNGRRAATLTRQAVELVDQAEDPRRVGLLHERLGSYLLPVGAREAGLAAFERAVELVPGEPPSADRVRVLAALGNALMLSWRHAESRAACEQALVMSEVIDDVRPALRASSVLAVDLCYLGRPEDGLRMLHEVRQQAMTVGTPRDLAHSTVMLCEVLIATGQLGEAAEAALEGLAICRRAGLERGYGILLAAYAGEAFLELGDWSRTDEVLDAALPMGAAYWSHYPNLLRAQLAVGRGKLDGARQYLEAGAHGAQEPTSAARHARLTAEIALWEGRSDDAARAVEAGLRGPKTGAAFQRTRLAVVGIQAAAERRQLASIARDAAATNAARRDARRLLAEARRSSMAAAISPDAAAWCIVAEAEHSRVAGQSNPDRWQAAVAAMDELDRPFPAACCRWRLAEALVAGGHPTEATVAARDAFRVASRLGARMLMHELRLLAERARLDLVGLRAEDARPLAAASSLGLTPREAEVLLLLARGYTNRQIAAELVISVKTASVHVSHILGKLDVPSRIEAARIAQRLVPAPTSGR